MPSSLKITWMLRDRHCQFLKGSLYEMCIGCKWLVQLHLEAVGNYKI